MNTNDPRFVPPHCPHSDCLYHKQLTAGWRFKCIGTFWRQVKPNRIRRFQCLHCRRTFSTQTFSTTYWLKRPDILAQLPTRTTGCMANRQIARDLHVAPSTIDRQLSRLGRHCLLYHTRQMQTAKPLSRIVIDGFVSFEYSQYFPFHHHLAIESDTDFLAYFTDSEVRRSGAMTPAQKRRRARLEEKYGRPDPKAVFKDMLHLMEVVTVGLQQVTVLSDEHKTYPRVFKELPCEVIHVITSSRERRDAGNPMFPANLADMLVRHSSANHKRETIAWSKRRQASAERLAVFLVWRNYLKGRREKVRGSPTPAQARGMMDHRVDVAELLELRLFIGHIRLPARWEEYYRRMVITRVLPRQRPHGLRYAV